VLLVFAGEYRHYYLSLTLLVLGVLADHPHHTLAVDDLALIADFLYRCSYLHSLSVSRFTVLS